jgi:peptidoglycan L-alanyl-D-glutamate endopeptidase CwlK
MDPLARQTALQPLHPAFRQLVEQLQSRLRALGLPLEPFETVRTPERQVDLYAQGRVQGRGQLGRCHTWSKAWHSYHQYGLAVDMVWHVAGQWSWDPPPHLPDGWARYQQVVAQLGLQPVRDHLGRILEQPHCQLAWPEVKLLAGEYPPGGDLAWSGWLNEQAGRWGNQARVVDGIAHQAAPPLVLPADHRPALADS